MDMLSALPAPSTSGVSDLSSHGEDTSYLQRLFVGWVPKHYTEKDLIELFSNHGIVRDCIVLKDKVTGQPRGAAFVSYATKDEAAAAITALNRQVHLPGAQCPLEVRFAKNHHFVPAGTGPPDNRQLFFSGAPPSFSEEDLSVMFSAYGTVEEISLFRDRKSGDSKGAGFVMMATREEACRALEVLGSGSHHEPGGSSAGGLRVKWADPELQHKKKSALELSNVDNRMLFFARVQRSASEEEVKTLFSHFGRVYDVVLFRAFQGAPTSRGCGLVTMGSHQEAAAALDALNSKYTWGGMQSPMIVKWMDAALQKRRREHHMAATRQELSMPVVGLQSSGGMSNRGGISNQGGMGILPGVVGQQVPQLLQPLGLPTASLQALSGAQVTRQHPHHGLAVPAARPHQALVATSGARTADGVPALGLHQGVGGGAYMRGHSQSRAPHGAAGAGAEWLQLGMGGPLPPGGMPMAGPAGYAALAAPMFPLSRRDEPSLNILTQGGQQLQPGPYQLVITNNGGGPAISQVFQPVAAHSSQLVYICPEYLSL